MLSILHFFEIIILICAIKSLEYFISFKLEIADNLFILLLESKTKLIDSNNYMRLSFDLTFFLITSFRSFNDKILSLIHLIKILTV